MSEGTFLRDTIVIQQGSFGVGLTSLPSYKLHVAGNSYIDATAGSPTLLLGRYSGNASIKAATDDSGYLIMDSSGAGTGRAALNWYSSDHVVLAYGGGNVGIGTTSPSTKLHISESTSPIILIESQTTVLADGDTIGEIRFKNNDASGTSPHICGAVTSIAEGVYGRAGLAFSTGRTGEYGERLRIGYNGFVGINTTTPTVNLSVNGELSCGDGMKLTFIGLDINSQSTPSFIKIRTKIPFASGSADFTVNIKGFQYGSAQMTSLTVGWHYWNSTFYNSALSSSGAYAPVVKLSAEDWDSSGTKKVCIVLVAPGYWPKLYVESMYSSAYSDAYANGWTWDTNDATATGSELVTPAYKSNFGNNFVMLSNGNVGIGTSSPSSAKLDVRGRQYNLYTGADATILHLHNDSATGYGAYIRVDNYDVSRYALRIDNGTSQNFTVPNSGGLILANLTDNVDQVRITRAGYSTTHADAKLYIYDNSDADWAQKISLDGYGYGLRIDGFDTHGLNLVHTTLGTVFITTANQVVVNEDGQDCDFRVESDTNDHMLFVDAATNEVGIGISTPSATLDVIRGNTTNAGTAIFRGTTYTSHFNYSTSEDTYIRAGKAGADVILADVGGGSVGIGTTNPTQKLHVSGNSLVTGKLIVTGSTSNQDSISITNGRLQVGRHSSGSGIWFNGAGNATVWFHGLYTDSQTSAIRWYYSGDRMTLNTNGSLRLNNYGSGSFTGTVTRYLAVDASGNVIESTNAGAQGFQGSTGAQGAAGPAGPAGTSGSSGANGATGPTGPAGAQGPTGPQGLRGYQGYQGVQGATGPTGPTGSQGPEGPQGLRGFQGYTGPQGPRGYQGYTGPNGSTGPTGPAGAQGPEGPQGLRGFQGYTGPQGPRGYQGFQGPFGPAGPAGPAGPTGPTGDKYAIVEAFDKNSYIALACVEMPEVRFDEIMVIKPNKRKQLITPIDYNYIYVCEPDSIEPISYTTSEPCICGLNVKGHNLHISFEQNVPDVIRVKLSGIRKGRLNKRFERFTYEQMMANNAFWTQWKNK